MIKDVLDGLGFSGYKRDAYLALVKLQMARVGPIAKEANIPSSKIYETLHRLHREGYISVVQKRPLTYRANDPRSMLMGEVRSRIASLQRIETEIKDLRTTLSIASTGSFEVTQGYDAFYRKVKEAVGKSHTTIVAVVKHWHLDSELRELNIAFTGRGGALRVIGPMGTKNKDVTDEWKRTGAKVKHSATEATRFSVWDSRIVSIRLDEGKSKEEYLSLWIENEYLASILMKHFDQLWKKKVTLRS